MARRTKRKVSQKRTKKKKRVKPKAKKKVVRKKFKKKAKKTTQKKTAKRKTKKKKAPRKKTPKRAEKKTAKKKTVKKSLRHESPVWGVEAGRYTPSRTLSKSSVTTAVSGEKVGVVVHYYTHLGVAVIRLNQGELQVGDTIHIKGHTTDFKQRIESMEVEHQRIIRAVTGQEFGLKVSEHVREHDDVYKVVGSSLL